MVDFLKHLPPETQNRIKARMHAESREVERLYNLTDRWLGHALLKAARGIRACYPEKLSDPNERTYCVSLCWHVLPEVARRLGASGIGMNEATRTRALSNTDFRSYAGFCWQNVGLNELNKAHWISANSGIKAGDILSRHPVNGNVIHFALDRFCPPSSDADDVFTRHFVEVARRRGVNGVNRWSPDLFVRYENRQADRDDAEAAAEYEEADILEITALDPLP